MMVLHQEVMDALFALGHQGCLPSCWDLARMQCPQSSALTFLANHGYKRH
jgi:hypothetical protein